MQNSTEVHTEVGCNTKNPTITTTNNNNKRYRGYSITINNPTDNDYTTMADVECQYACWQTESGENNTKHIQGCIYFTNAKAFSAVKKLFPRAHIEPAKKFSKLRDYCMKEESRIDGPYEKGTPPKQGERTDLTEAAKDYLKVGEKQFAEENPDIFIKYYKGLKALENTVKSHRDVNNPPTVTWLYGAAGVGKSRRAFEQHSESCYIKDGTQWWDGYTGQEAIIIDDFDGRWPYRDFLRLLDRYPYQGQYKGGYVKITSPFIYITCEHDPGHYWAGNELEQVVRRLSHCYLITTGGESREIPRSNLLIPLTRCLTLTYI